jgi:hypothetical protein
VETIVLLSLLATPAAVVWPLWKRGVVENGERLRRIRTKHRKGKP